MCVGDSVWMGCSGIHVAGWSISRIPLQPNHTETPNTHRTKNNVVIRQNSRKLLMMDILMSETCWAHKKWNKIASDYKLVFYSSTITMMHSPINIRSFFFTISATIRSQLSLPRFISLAFTERQNSVTGPGLSWSSYTHKGVGTVHKTRTGQMIVLKPLT